MDTLRRTVKLTTSDGRDLSEELTQFSNAIRLERDAPGRISTLLVMQMYLAFKAGRLNPAKITRTIYELEDPTRTSQLKPPTQFEKPALAGLWHKHYLPDGIRTVAKNVLLALNKDGIPWLEEKVKASAESGITQYVTQEDIAKIATDVTSGGWMRRANASKLTGEWLIYAQHNEANYYLCISNHDDGDENIRRMIDSICVLEFPFLSAILGPTGNF